MPGILGSVRSFRVAVACAFALSLCPSSASAQTEARIELRLETSEAEAVLAILAKRRSGEPVGAADWRRLFDSEPYQRLKEREAEMQRAFTDESFRRFVLSDSLLARAAEMRHTLEAWRSRDLRASARRVLDYLPTAARIRAAVYLMIKPRTNSFVSDLGGNPAIFLYLDPAQSPAKFENTVAHELHHIGFAGVAQRPDAGESDLSPDARTAVGWMDAFGEGFAMLAAAGDPEMHPHAASPAEVRARWDRDMADFNKNLRRLEAFFLDIIDGRLNDENEIRERGFSFFGVQGPWYTVGYRMAVVVERRYGREALIASMADPPQLLARYNAAAQGNADEDEPPAVWSPRLLELIGARTSAD